MLFVSASIGVVQNTKQHPFLIHAGSVYTICILFLFLFLCKERKGMSQRTGRCIRDHSDANSVTVICCYNEFSQGHL